MGQPTPDGVTIEREAKVPETAPAEPLSTAPAAPPPPLSPAENFVDALEQYAQTSPEAAGFTAGLIREIYEATGIVENNPDEPSANAPSRLDMLNDAIQSSNAPAELKAAAQDIFGVDEGHAILIKIKGLMESGSGLVSRLSNEAGAEQSENNKRERADFAMAIAASRAAEAARQAAETAVRDVLDNNRPLLNNLYSEASQMRASGQSAEEIGLHVSEGLSPVIDESFGASFDAALAEGASPEEAARIASEETVAVIQNELETGSGMTDPEIDATMAGVHAQVAALEAQRIAFEAQQSNDIQNWSTWAANSIGSVFNTVSGMLFGEPSDAKQQVVNTMAEYQAALAESMTAQENGLNAMESALAEQRIALEGVKASLDSSYTIEEAEHYYVQYREQLAVVDSLTATMTEQRETLALYKDVNQLTADYTSELLGQLNDDLSNLDEDFLKRAVINCPPELAQKSQELLARTGNEGQDPLNMLRAMAEDPNNSLSDEQRQEIRVFFTELDEAVTELREVEALKAEIEAEKAELQEQQDRLNVLRAEYEANSDYLIVPVGPGNGPLRPEMPTADNPNAIGSHLYAVEEAIRAKTESIAALEERVTESQDRISGLLGTDAPPPALVPAPPSNEPSPREIGEQLLAGRDQISAYEIASYFDGKLEGEALAAAIDEIVAELPDGIRVLDAPYNPVSVDLYNDPEPELVAAAPPPPRQEPQPEIQRNTTPAPPVGGMGNA